jgi:PST family polysaccharide transporter
LTGSFVRALPLNSPFENTYIRLSVKNKLISSVGWNSLTVVLQVVIQLIYTSILARLISPDSFALMGIALSVVGFAEVFSQIGIGPALVQRKDIGQQHLNGAFYVSVILGVSFTVIFVAIAPWIGAYYQSDLLSDVIQVVSISFTLSAISIIPRSLMIKRMNFKKFFWSGMLSIIGGNLIVGLWLAWLGWDIWAYVFALVAQNLILTVSFWILEPVKITRSWKWQQTRELVRYGGGSTLFNAFNFLATRIDVLMVPSPGRNASDTRSSSAGIYERSSYLMGLPITILGKLSENVLFSGMAMLQDEKSKLQKTFLGAVYFIGILVIPGCIFIILFAKEIVLTYLGPDYESGIIIVQILFIGVAFRSLVKLCDSVLRALNALYIGSVIKLGFVVIMGIGIFFAMPYGLPYVAWAVVGATLLQFVFISALSLTLLDLRWSNYLLALFAALRIGIITLSISIPLRYLFDYYDLSLLLALSIAVIANGIAIVVLAWIRPSIFGRGEQNALKMVLGRFAHVPVVKRLLDRLK